MPTIDELKLDGEEPQEAERVPDIAPEALDALRLDPLSLAEADADQPPPNIPPALLNPLDAVDDDDQDEDVRITVLKDACSYPYFKCPILNALNCLFIRVSTKYTHYRPSWLEVSCCQSPDGATVNICEIQI